MENGFTRPRPAKKSSQANPEVHPLSPLTHRTQRYQALPEPLGEPPYQIELARLIPEVIERIEANEKLVFHVVGDTGGVKTPQYQMNVATAMKADLDRHEANRPAFFYHLGDVVYYNGEHDQYFEQFYQPYDHYHAPILGIPGNHDGDPLDTSQTSLAGWVACFMTPKPVVDPESRDAQRYTLSLPNVYFTLNCPLATIVGIYSNVPEYGSIDSVQQQWLTNEFATAPKDKALLVSVHHPIYSFDDHHSGSTRMADVIQHAINDSRRVPNMVLTAHVHNYQRIEREIIPGSVTPFLVAGHGGYWHLHKITVDNGHEDEKTKARLISSEQNRHGYVTLTIDKETISGSMTTVAKEDGKVTPDVDTFAYPARALFLEEGTFVRL